LLIRIVEADMGRREKRKTVSATPVFTIASIVLALTMPATGGEIVSDETRIEEAANEESDSRLGIDLPAAQREK
jgi:hypothetical protein